MSGYYSNNRHDTRIIKKLVKLGTDSPVCLYCEVTDCRCLLALGGIGDETTVCCHNCRAKRKIISGKALERKRKRFAEAGYPQPACVVCNESDLRALEGDHLSGDANSVSIEPLCLNHHAIKSDDAEDHFPQLRLRDPNRPALLKQAAFEIGLALVLLLMASLRDEADALSVFFGMTAISLFGWAAWNVAADRYFAEALGIGYDKNITIKVPS
jgi:hypothetical protein